MAVTLELLYESFDTWVKELRRKTGIDVHTAKDIVQDAFIKLWTKKYDIENYPQEFITAFMRKVIYNQFKVYIRTEMRRKTREQMSIESIEYAVFYRHYSKPQLDAIYDLAGPASAKILRDAYEKNMTKTAIAKKHGITDDAARMHLQQGRARIKKNIKLLYPLFMYIRRHCKDELEKT